MAMDEEQARTLRRPFATEDQVGQRAMPHAACAQVRRVVAKTHAARMKCAAAAKRVETRACSQIGACHTRTLAPTFALRTLRESVRWPFHWRERIDILVVRSTLSSQ